MISDEARPMVALRGVIAVMYGVSGIAQWLT